MRSGSGVNKMHINLASWPVTTTTTSAHGRKLGLIAATTLFARVVRGGCRVVGAVDWQAQPSNMHHHHHHRQHPFCALPLMRGERASWS